MKHGLYLYESCSSLAPFYLALMTRDMTMSLWIGSRSGLLLWLFWVSWGWGRPHNLMGKQQSGPGLVQLNEDVLELGWPLTWDFKCIWSWVRAQHNENGSYHWSNEPTFDHAYTFGFWIVWFLGKGYVYVNMENNKTQTHEWVGSECAYAIIGWLYVV